MASPWIARHWYTLQGHWPRLARVAAWLRQDIFNEVLLAPIEPILHPSSWRIGWLGAFILIGQPLFGWLWEHWQPQPWEDLRLRFAAGSLGIVLLFLAVRGSPLSRGTRLIFNLIWWVELPLLFSWMYLCNGGNSVWLASVVAMVLIYYQAVDWRIATVGVALGALVASLLYGVMGPMGPMGPVAAGEDHAANTAILAFTWCAAVVLGFSTANQRRVHMKRTLTTVGIMAHELRTPLATISLISEALHNIGPTLEPHAAASLERCASRLGLLVRNMNHQIDTQIVNARMLRLSPLREPIDASQLLLRMVEHFPFRNVFERDAVEIRVHQNFVFRSSPALFVQVFENLLKNALKALAATDSPLARGDVVIEIATADGKGRLIFSDRGVGMAPALRHRIFEPFFSSDSHSGHGLGLAFCRRVVKSADGSIRVESKPGCGATFVIELPLTRRRDAATAIQQRLQETP